MSKSTTKENELRTCVCINVCVKGSEAEKSRQQGLPMLLASFFLTLALKKSKKEARALEGGCGGRGDRRKRRRGSRSRLERGMKRPWG